MAPDPPPTPRLHSLPGGVDDADSLWGTTPEVTTLRAQVELSLAGKKASLQPVSEVPLIYTQSVMEHFGFKRRHFCKLRSVKYIAGWPLYTAPRKEGRLAPIRGRMGWGVHPALSFTFDDRALCHNASAARFPTLFSTPSFAHNKLGDCNYCKSRDLLCPARNWTFLGSNGTLPDHHTLDEAVAYEEWMEEHAEDAQFTQPMKKRKRVLAASVASVGGTQRKKRASKRVGSLSSPAVPTTPAGPITPAAPTVPPQSAQNTSSPRSSPQSAPTPQMPPTPESRPPVTPASMSVVTTGLGRSTPDPSTDRATTAAVNRSSSSTSNRPNFPMVEPLSAATESSSTTAEQTVTPAARSLVPTTIADLTPVSSTGSASSYPSCPGTSSLSSSSLNALGISLPAPRHPEEVMAAHNLLWTEYQLQQTRLAAIPSLESRLAHLSSIETSHAALEKRVSELQSHKSSLTEQVQLAQVELTVLRASQRARDERIAALEADLGKAEQKSREMEQRAETMERRAQAGISAKAHARRADERALVAEEKLAVAHRRVQSVEAEAALAKAHAEEAKIAAVAARSEKAQAKEESMVARAEAEAARRAAEEARREAEEARQEAARVRDQIMAEGQEEDGEISDDPIALLLVRRKLAETQTQLADGKKEKQALSAELVRMKTELELVTSSGLYE